MDGKRGCIVSIRVQTAVMRSTRFSELSSDSTPFQSRDRLVGAGYPLGLSVCLLLTPHPFVSCGTRICGGGG